MSQHLIGVDVGTSSVKAAVICAASGRCLGEGTSPQTELPINAPNPGWAEQHPEVWWEHTIHAIRRAVTESKISASSIGGIGIAYQMHGLVALGRNGEPVRPAIIWCDGRAVETGNEATTLIGREKALKHLLNPLGNFTVAKLLWVRANEPDLFRQISHIMLPGDYVGFRMTGEVGTTISGLSEGMAWDFTLGTLSPLVKDVLGLSTELFPTVRPSFAPHGAVSTEAAELLGIPAGIPLTYKAGDQPNNAFSLNVLSPGVTAVSAGTSGVLYTVTDKLVADPEGRINTFMHVNGTAAKPVCSTLLCLNGVGSAYRWLRNEGFRGESYAVMNREAEQSSVGASGLLFYPFGNGSERILRGAAPGAKLHGLDFNRHTRGDIARAVQEGVAFAFRYGMDYLAALGSRPTAFRGPYSSMFLNRVFCTALTSVGRTSLELLSTDGAQGAARGAGIGAGLYADYADAFMGLTRRDTVHPQDELVAQYEESYQRWKDSLGGMYEEE